MGTARGLNRLLRLRRVEEELSGLELEASVRTLRHIEEAVEAIRERQAVGRRGFVAAVQRGDAVERAGELVAMEAAAIARAGLEPRIQEADAETERLRADFLLRRAGRRQVEALIDVARREAASKDLHRAQQRLDDWYGNRGRQMRLSGKPVSGESVNRTTSKLCPAGKSGTGVSGNCESE